MFWKKLMSHIAFRVEKELGPTSLRSAGFDTCQNAKINFRVGGDVR